MQPRPPRTTCPTSIVPSYGLQIPGTALGVGRSSARPMVWFRAGGGRATSDRPVLRTSPERRSVLRSRIYRLRAHLMDATSLAARRSGLHEYTYLAGADNTPVLCLSRQPTGRQRPAGRSASGVQLGRPESAARAAPWAALNLYRKFSQTRQLHGSYATAATPATPRSPCAMTGG